MNSTRKKLILHSADATSIDIFSAETDVLAMAIRPLPRIVHKHKLCHGNRIESSNNPTQPSP